MITQREFLLAFLLPAALCVLLGMLGARLPEGGRRRALQALAAALPCLLAFRAGPDCVRLFVPALALLVAWARAPHEVLATLGLFAWLFTRLSAPPGWPERVAAALAVGIAWVASGRATAGFPAWRPLLVLSTLGGAVACACLCGRSASLAVAAAGVAAVAGSGFLASLRRPAWSFGEPGFAISFYGLAAALACAVYLAELPRTAALALLASAAAARGASFPFAYAAQLALTALGLWIAWPADGFGT